jgi:hypothetical protein
MVLILVASRAGGAKAGATLTKDFSQGVVRLVDLAAGFNHGAAFGHQHAVNGAEASVLNWNAEDNSCDAQPVRSQTGSRASSLNVMPGLDAGIHETVRQGRSYELSLPRLGHGWPGQARP